MGIGRARVPGADAVVARPDGSDLLEEWEVFYGLAKRLGVQLEFEPDAATGNSEPIPVDMTNKPTTGEMYAANLAGSRIPLDEVKKFEHGHVFEADLKVLPKDPDHSGRLQIGDPTMMGELLEIAAEALATAQDEVFTYKLLSRRMRDYINSSGQDIPVLVRHGSHNPAFMNPEDLAELSLRA